MQWREWSGYFAASVYADFHDIEYNAIREQAALIDVSPLYKYEVRGRDAERLVDRVITRDATKLKVGQVFYTPVVRRGRQGRRRRHDPSPGRRPLPLDRRRPAVPLAEPERGRARRRDRGHQRVDRRAGPPGAAQPGRPRGRAARRRPRPTCATSGAAARPIAGIPIDVSRTGYTGDLGYELWVAADRAVDLWDAVIAPASPFGIRPAGMIALDVVRLEAGLILLEVDYTSARHAMNAEQAYSPGEIGLGRLVDFDKGDFVGRRALLEERRAGGPRRRLVGLEIELARHRRDVQRPGPAADRAGRRRSLGHARCTTRAATRSAGSPATAGARSSRSRSRWPRCRPPTSARARTSRPNGRSRPAAAGSAQRSSSCPSWTCPASAPEGSACWPSSGPGRRWRPAGPVRARAPGHAPVAHRRTKQAISPRTSPWKCPDRPESGPLVAARRLNWRRQASHPSGRNPGFVLDWAQHRAAAARWRKHCPAPGRRRPRSRVSAAVSASTAAWAAARPTRRPLAPDGEYHGRTTE